MKHQQPPFHPSEPLDDSSACDALLEAVLAAPDAQQAQRRDRLFDRVGDSVRAHAGLVTVRARRASWRVEADGVRSRALIERSTPPSFRPGQPRSARIVELAPGAHWLDADDLNDQREWLVLQGDVALQADDGEAARLGPLDFHVAPAGCPPRRFASVAGALLYRRCAPRPASAPQVAPAQTVLDANTPWAEYGPGILRRTVWTSGAEAAYLVRAQAGAQVPAHGHRLDEECLMLDGDLYLGDILLRAGDYQLAPVGSQHGPHLADSTLTLLVRGDVELRFDA
jgi:quercetin dioxygenase-like cupin family protein